MVDSTGVKVFGEGEWKVRRHGYSKRRTWKKIHIAVNEKGEIIAKEVTGNDVHDACAVTSLLNQIQERIASFGGDGAYDKRNVYAALLKRGIADIRIPPQHNAKIWQHGNSKEKSTLAMKTFERYEAWGESAGRRRAAAIRVPVLK